MSEETAPYGTGAAKPAEVSAANPAHASGSAPSTCGR